MRNIVLPASLAAGLVLLVAVSTEAPAQTHPAAAQHAVDLRSGTQLFRALLKHSGIRPVKASELTALHHERAHDLIVISLGNPAALHEGWHFPAIATARHALQGGGAALIASDQHLRLEPLLLCDANSQSSGQIAGPLVLCPEADVALRELEGCPFVEPIPCTDKALQSIFEGDGGDERRLTRVAVNNSSYLTFQQHNGPSHFQRLARFPRACQLQADEGQMVPLPDNAIFALGGTGVHSDQHRLYSFQFLALADHSVFINQMLVEPGTDNLEFTYRVIRYLQGPQHAPGTGRSRCAFFENGVLVEQFDELGKLAVKAQKPSLPIPQPSLEAVQRWLVDNGNRFIDHLQKNNVPNKLVNDVVGVPTFIRILLLLAAGYGGFYLCRRLWGARKPGNIPPAPLVKGASSGPPGVFERRQTELLRRDNVYEPVRDLVREFFDSTGIPADPGLEPPKLEIGKMVRKPKSLTQAIRDFWDLAYGEPRVLKVQQWMEMEVYFERVRQAHADGKWRFVLPTTPGSRA
jgi:hypothetical protein